MNLNPNFLFDFWQLCVWEFSILFPKEFWQNITHCGQQYLTLTSLQVQNMFKSLSQSHYCKDQFQSSFCSHTRCTDMKST